MMSFCYDASNGARRIFTVRNGTRPSGQMARQIISYFPHYIHPHITHCTVFRRLPTTDFSFFRDSRSTHSVPIVRVSRNLRHFSIGRTVRSIFIHFNFVPFPENPITANRHQNAIHTPRNFPALSKRKWFDWSEREGRGWEFKRFPPATARLFLFWIKRVRLVPTTTTLERESELEKRKVS